MAVSYLTLKSELEQPLIIEELGLIAEAEAAVDDEIRLQFKEVDSEIRINKKLVDFSSYPDIKESRRRIMTLELYARYEAANWALTEENIQGRQIQFLLMQGIA